MEYVYNGKKYPSIDAMFLDNELMGKAIKIEVCYKYHHITLEVKELYDKPGHLRAAQCPQCEHIFQA